MPDRTFYGIWNDVYVEDNLLFYDEKLLVTKELIPYVLRRLHKQHQGKEKTYKLAKQIFFFPNMKNLIRVMISN